MSPRPIRWKPGLRLALFGLAAIAWVRWREEWPFQKRNLISYEVGLVTIVALGIWWFFLSRATWRLRLLVLAGALGLLALLIATVHVRGMSGDMVPQWEWRWNRQQVITASPSKNSDPVAALKPHPDFPQFYGPDRTGVLPGPRLAADWTAHPPQQVWRKPIGPGWSGFAVVGDLCLTQEQRGETECVTALTLATGEQRWVQSDPAHYNSIIGGEGPRATPTVADHRVYTLGSTGVLNCLRLENGERVWSQDVVAAVNGRKPEWGSASSPLLVDDLVIVHGGERGTHSLLAYRANNGTLAWKGGEGSSSSYATPVLATLAGVRQILAFNARSISGHDPKTGATLWQRPWGNGNVVCAAPMVVDSEKVLFSSGYGVGAELLKLTPSAQGLEAASLWRSTRMKAKFSHLYIRDGCVFGLDDGIFACADLSDGSRHWREGRYGHGQGLAVGDHYLLMAESGELVLLRPTREAPNELARFPVLSSKTWNPIALAGDLLLVRNDREAVCLKLPVQEAKP